MMTLPHRFGDRILSFAVAAGVVWIWYLVSASGIISPLFLPGPERAWASLVKGFQNGTLVRQTMGTLQHMFFGWLVASILGVVLGSAIGMSRAARAATMPTLEFLRPLPASAVIPLAIAFLGLSNSMATFVIAFGTIWPMLLSTIHGFATVEPRLYEVARVLNLSRMETIRKIVLPSALPDILAGMRISVTGALILSVVCEMIGGLEGLGHYIMVSARLYRSPDLFAGVIILGAIGYVSSTLVSLAEARLLRWRERGH
ncbi:MULTISPECIES: ABC transporter permease [unclassified Haematobacter]|uniref:ABC transporter permease n=1 Tax=unclassified Haematobacter TaxID=2640585 RepID=UPI0025B97796|nr:MULTISPECIES: ABC transporter permease [unclassified Haematobacter]